jgi:hypothetical protein
VISFNFTFLNGKYFVVKEAGLKKELVIIIFFTRYYYNGFVRQVTPFNTQQLPHS